MINNKKKVFFCTVLILVFIMSWGKSVTAENAKADFIDISNHQQNLSVGFFNGLKNQGIKGTVVKVSEGTYYKDPFAAANIQKSQNAGLVTSAYHFARFNTVKEATAEANFFAAKLQEVGFDKNSGYVVLDIEHENTTANRTVLTTAANTFVNNLKSKGYNYVDIYTGNYYIMTRLNADQLSIKNPWIAAYPQKPDQHVSSLTYKGGAGAWQFSSTYRVSGYNGPLDASIDYSGKYTGQNGGIYYSSQFINKTDYIKGNAVGSVFSRAASLAGATDVGGIANYTGQKVKLTAEVKTNNGVYYQAQDERGKSLGFVSNNQLNGPVDPVLSSKAVRYNATVIRKTDGVNTAPFNTAGWRFLSNSDKYYNQVVEVIEEKTTRRGNRVLTWAKFKHNGNVIGWIDKAGLDSFDPILSSKAVNYGATVVRKTDGVNTAPFNTAGWQLLSYSDAYIDQEIEVIEEAVTQRSTWVKFKYKGKVIGWMDKSGVRVQDPILSTTKVNYKAIVSRKTDGINTAPFNTKGWKLNSYSSKYYNQEVEVIEEAITQRSTWVKIKYKGNTIGWMDKAGLRFYDPILSTKKVAYKAIISRKTDGVNTAPFDTEGWKLISYSSKYYNQEVEVVEEAVTQRSTWVKFKHGGKEVGWIDKAGLRLYDPILSTKAVSYKAVVTRKTDGVNTAPFGTEGWKLISYSDTYFNQTVEVIEEAVTQRSTWVKFKYAGKEIGWMDKAGTSPLKKAIDKVEEEPNAESSIEEENIPLELEPTEETSSAPEAIVDETIVGGKDVEKGRYRLTATTEGTVQLFSATNQELLAQVLLTGNQPISQIELDIKEGQTLIMTNQLTYHLEKIEEPHVFGNLLPTGLWLVGRDIPAGQYQLTDVSSAENLTILADADSSTVTKRKSEAGMIEIAVGEWVRISDSEKVELVGVNQDSLEKN